MPASQHSPHLNDIDLNHTHIRQDMREYAETRHTKKLTLYFVAIALLLGGIVYSVAHSNLLDKLETLNSQPTIAAQQK